MKIDGPGGSRGSDRVYLKKLAAKLRAAGIGGTPGSDEVEISDVGRFLSYLSQLPQVRQEKVEALRRDIENGTYDVDEKLDAIVDKLIEDMGVKPQRG